MDTIDIMVSLTEAWVNLTVYEQICLHSYLTTKKPDNGPIMYHNIIDNLTSSSLNSLRKEKFIKLVNLFLGKIKTRNNENNALNTLNTLTNNTSTSDNGHPDNNPALNNPALNNTTTTTKTGGKIKMINGKKYCDGKYEIVSEDISTSPSSSNEY